MTVYWSDAQLAHRDTHFVRLGRIAASEESVSRAERIVRTLEARGKPMREPADFGLEPILAVHDAGYVAFLREAFDRWTAEFGEGTPFGTGCNMLPNVFPYETYAQKPGFIVGEIGWYMADMAAEIVEGTWTASYAAAQAAIQAARLTGRGEGTHYALCRPPGHHAQSGRAMGFCYLNNSAIAAEELRRSFAKVAILDVDVHHGNGTQQIFYDRADVFTASIHSHPSNFYPFFTGYPDERGAGEGTGFNLNLTFDFGAGDDQYLDALARAIAAVGDYEPEALVLALGVDASEHDRHGRHSVTRRAFTAMAERVRDIGLPTVIVQEGGYESDVLGHLVADVLDVFGT